ncbi:protease complex subunit PrcB family protein [Sungkyunkwania multivorans]|uniref:Protease complex subunit PrcB family protein n=1 Tax=Sungkyunkwania multivorans TaxID=1173618 RepID=A0ABW3D002_9FLAO
MKSIFLVLLTIILSCGGSRSPVNNEQQPDKTKNERPMSISQEKKYEVLVQDASGGPVEPQILVIKEPKALQDFYIKINMTRRPGYPLPNIDFDKEMVVILCMGQKNTGGYSIDIDSVEELEGTRRIWVRENGPGPNDMATMALTEPFCIVKMTATDKKIVFEKVQVSKK